MERRGRRSLRGIVQIPGDVQCKTFQKNLPAFLGLLFCTSFRRERCPQRSAAQIDGSQKLWKKMKQKTRTNPRLPRFERRDGIQNSCTFHLYATDYHFNPTCYAESSSPDPSTIRMPDSNRHTKGPPKGGPLKYAKTDQTSSMMHISAASPRRGPVRIMRQ